MLKEGAKAPDFCLPAAGEEEVCLEDFRESFLPERTPPVIKRLITGEVYRRRYPAPGFVPLCP